MMFIRGTGVSRYYRVDRVEITPHGSMLAVVAVITEPEVRDMPEGAQIIGKLLYTGGWRPFQELRQDPAYKAASRTAAPRMRELAVVTGPEFRSENLWASPLTHIIS
jgi:hypothetical protein